MAESVATRLSSSQPPSRKDLLVLLLSIQADLQALQTALNAHTHGGTAASTGQAPALNTTP